METHKTTDHDRSAAHDALAQATRSEEAVRRPALPGWFFPSMALLIGLLLAAQMLDSDTRTTAVAGVLVVCLLLNGYAQRVAGVSWASHRLRGQLPFLLTLLAVVAVSAVLVAVTGQAWIWAVGGVVAAAVVAMTGVFYTRRLRTR